MKCLSHGNHISELELCGAVLLLLGLCTVDVNHKGRSIALSHLSILNTYYTCKISCKMQDTAY